MKNMLVLTLLLCSSLAAGTKSIGDPIGTNFPKDGEGRVYHLGLKKGEIANRILLVGDPDRAKLIVSCLDNPETVFAYASNRGFTTYTGTKNAVPVTIMSIGIGMPMMDFAVREIRAITEGPLYMIRLGSCGTPHDEIAIGTVAVAKESYGVITDHDAYHNGSRALPFHVTSPILPDAALHKSLVNALNSCGTFPVSEGSDATADSFYGSQGRIDENFDDRNTTLIDKIMSDHPDTFSLQMETYHLFHLAKLNANAGQNEIHAAACAIVLAQRKSGAFLSNDLKHEIEIASGNACLEALIAP